jgi:hypothetical protein
MPSHLDWVTINVDACVVFIPWASRDALLNRIVHLESMWPVVAAFRAVGATGPVELTRSQKLGLLDVIDAWATDGDADALPAGLNDVRAALRDNLDGPR